MANRQEDSEKHRLEQAERSNKFEKGEHDQEKFEKEICDRFDSEKQDQGSEKEQSIVHGAGSEILAGGFSSRREPNEKFRENSVKQNLSETREKESDAEEYAAYQDDEQKDIGQSLKETPQRQVRDFGNEDASEKKRDSLIEKEFSESQLKISDYDLETGPEIEPDQFDRYENQSEAFSQREITNFQAGAKYNTQFYPENFLPSELDDENESRDFYTDVASHSEDEKSLSTGFAKPLKNDLQYEADIDEDRTYSERTTDHEISHKTELSSDEGFDSENIQRVMNEKFVENVIMKSFQQMAKETDVTAEMKRSGFDGDQQPLESETVCAGLGEGQKRDRTYDRQEGVMDDQDEKTKIDQDSLKNECAKHEKGSYMYFEDESCMEYTMDNMTIEKYLADTDDKFDSEVRKFEGSFDGGKFSDDIRQLMLPMDTKEEKYLEDFGEENYKEDNEKYFVEHLEFDDGSTDKATDYDVKEDFIYAENRVYAGDQLGNIEQDDRHGRKSDDNGNAIESMPSSQLECMKEEKITTIGMYACSTETTEYDIDAKDEASFQDRGPDQFSDFEQFQKDSLKEAFESGRLLKNVMIDPEEKIVLEYQEKYDVEPKEKSRNGRGAGEDLISEVDGFDASKIHPTILKDESDLEVSQKPELINNGAKLSEDSGIRHFADFECSDELNKRDQKDSEECFVGSRDDQKIEEKPDMESKEKHDTESQEKGRKSSSTAKIVDSVDQLQGDQSLNETLYLRLDGDFDLRSRENNDMKSKESIDQKPDDFDHKAKVLIDQKPKECFDQKQDREPKECFDQRPEDQKPNEPFGEKPVNQKSEECFDQKTDDIDEKPKECFYQRPEDQKPKECFDQKSEEHKPKECFDQKPEGQKPSECFDQEPKESFDQKQEDQEPNECSEQKSEDQKPEEYFDKKLYDFEHKPKECFDQMSDDFDHTSKECFDQKQKEYFDQTPEEQKPKDQKIDDFDVEQKECFVQMPKDQKPNECFDQKPGDREPKECFDQKPAEHQPKECFDQKSDDFDQKPKECFDQKSDDFDQKPKECFDQKHESGFEQKQTADSHLKSEDDAEHPTDQRVDPNGKKDRKPDTAHKEDGAVPSPPSGVKDPDRSTVDPDDLPVTDDAQKSYVQKLEDIMARHSRRSSNQRAGFARENSGKDFGTEDNAAEPDSGRSTTDSVILHEGASAGQEDLVKTAEKSLPTNASLETAEEMNGGFKSLGSVETQDLKLVEAGPCRPSQEVLSCDSDIGSPLSSMAMHQELQLSRDSEKFGLHELHNEAPGRPKVPVSSSERSFEESGRLDTESCPRFSETVEDEAMLIYAGAKSNLEDHKSAEKLEVSMQKEFCESGNDGELEESMSLEEMSLIRVSQGLVSCLMQDVKTFMSGLDDQDGKKPETLGSSDVEFVDESSPLQEKEGEGDSTHAAETKEEVANTPDLHSINQQEQHEIAPSDNLQYSSRSDARETSKTAEQISGATQQGEVQVVGIVTSSRAPEKHDEEGTVLSLSGSSPDSDAKDTELFEGQETVEIYEEIEIRHETLVTKNQSRNLSVTLENVITEEKVEITYTSPDDASKVLPGCFEENQSSLKSPIRDDGNMDDTPVGPSEETGVSPKVDDGSKFSTCELEKQVIGPIVTELEHQDEAAAGVSDLGISCSEQDGKDVGISPSNEEKSKDIDVSHLKSEDKETDELPTQPTAEGTEFHEQKSENLLLSRPDSEAAILESCGHVLPTSGVTHLRPEEDIKDTKLDRDDSQHSSWLPGDVRAGFSTEYVDSTEEAGVLRMDIDAAAFESHQRGSGSLEFPSDSEQQQTFKAMDQPGSGSAKIQPSDGEIIKDHHRPLDEKKAPEERPVSSVLSEYDEEDLSSQVGAEGKGATDEAKLEKIGALDVNVGGSDQFQSIFGAKDVVATSIGGPQGDDVSLADESAEHFCRRRTSSRQSDDSFEILSIDSSAGGLSLAEQCKFPPQRAPNVPLTAFCSESLSQPADIFHSVLVEPKEKQKRKASVAGSSSGATRSEEEVGVRRSRSSSASKEDVVQVYAISGKESYLLSGRQVGGGGGGHASKDPQSGDPESLDVGATGFSRSFGFYDATRRGSGEGNHQTSNERSEPYGRVPAAGEHVEKSMTYLPK